jgi:hypothetical protein
MANTNSEKALMGFAMSSNSLLQKIEAIENQTRDTLFRIESIMVTSFSVTQGIAASLTENNKILKEIKEIISRKSEAEKAQFGGGGGISKLLGLGGFIALTGIGMFGLAMAFQEAGKVSPTAIVSGIALFAAMFPIAKILGAIMADPSSGGVFGQIKVMKKLVLTMGMSMLMLVAMSLALNSMAPVSGDKLVAALAIGAVIYIMGQTFVQLIKAWEFSGIMNFMLNKNNTDDIMRAMFLMTIQMVVLAAAMNLMPSVKMDDAFNFVIISAAMIPLAVALVAMRFALPAIEKIKVGTIAKAGLAVAMLGLALVPVAMAARLVGKVGISEAEIQRLVSITMALAPLIAVIGVITAIINFAKEGKVGKNQAGQNNSLLKMDNSRKRNQKMNLKGIAIFGLQAVVILAVLALTAVAFKFGAPMIAAGAQAARQIDMIGVMKLMFTLGGLLLIGGLVIGMTIKMMKGKQKSQKTGLIPGMGSSSEKPGALSKQDLIASMVILPIIVLSMAAAVMAFKLMPSIPKIEDGFLSFVFITGIAIFIYGFAMAKVFSALAGKSKGPGAGMFGFGGSSKRGKLGIKDILLAALMVPIVALAIVGAAYVFQMMPATSAEMAPDLMWALKSSIALMIFGGAMIIIGKLAKNMDFKAAAKAMLVVALAALTILLVAFAFSLAGDISYGEAPPLPWSVGVGIALFILGGVILALGAIATVVTPVGILLGALTVLVGAAVLYAVAWIFTQIGKIDGLKEAAQTITDVLFMPFNAMVDLFKRFKDEIGIENMGALAAGIGQIALAWIGLSMALAGSAASGLFSKLAGVGGAIFDGITSFLGGEVEMTPSQLLKYLVRNSEKLVVTGNAIQMVSKAYTNVAGMSEAFIAGIAPFGDFVNRLGSYTGTLANENMKGLSKAYGQYAKANNSLDVTKVEATTKMFNALADLAKNNGENAMKVLADQLLNAVAQLSDAVADLDRAVAKQGKSTGGFGDAVSGALDKFKEVVTGNTKKVEAMTPKAGNNADIIEAIQDLEDTLVASGIKIKSGAY